MSNRRTLPSTAVALTVAVVAVVLALPAGAGNLDRDVEFSVTVSKVVEGPAPDATFDFTLECSSDEGLGESSLVSIDDPTFADPTSDDLVQFELGGGDEETFVVYVEFSRGTVITCRALEVGAPPGTGDITTTCVADDLVRCDDPEEGEIGEGGAGTASLTWVAVNQAEAFGEDVGGVDFEFTNVFEPAPTTASPTTATTAATTAAPATATAAAPRFTG